MSGERPALARDGSRAAKLADQTREADEEKTAGQRGDHLHGDPEEDDVLEERRQRSTVCRHAFDELEQHESGHLQRHQAAPRVSEQPSRSE